jgi:hypothetical protein
VPRRRHQRALSLQCSMHAVFSTPRGSKTPFDPEKMGAIHALLQLQTGETLLNQNHPVCKDWEPDFGGGIKRIFAAGPKSKAYTQVFGRNMPPNSAQFLTAAGKPAKRSILYRMVSSLIFVILQAESRTGGWAPTEMICKILHSLFRRLTLRTSTGSSRHYTILCSAS